MSLRILCKKATKNKPINRIILLLSVMCLLASCNKYDYYYERIKNISDHDQFISISYPYNNTIFPPEINSPTFLWNDTIINCTEWYVYFSDTSGNIIHSEKSYEEKWKTGPDIWNTIKLKKPDNTFEFTVIGIKNQFFRKKITYSKTRFSISPDSVGAPVFYRAVPLPFSYAVQNVNEIEWYMGNIGDYQPKKMLDNIPVCANCHSFSKNGSILAMDVDYANDKGSYTISDIVDSCIIARENIITWSTYRKSDGENTFGLLSQISPDGRYTVSTVKDRSVFVAIDDNFKYSQLFFPVKGILAYYDKLTNIFSKLNGACDKTFVQSNPSWSPDGKDVIFARNTRYSNEKINQSSSVLLTVSDAEEFIYGNKDFKFNLYRLPFNHGQGGEPAPVEGASHNGKSNYFARYSPDGKWIVFCQAESFMLLQPDSKLYIMPAEGGTPRLMNCNMEDMNSWHSWSPNSKWIVFASKNRGPYTQLYLTHIDNNGNDSPPVLLENLLFDIKAANIPEFYPGKTENFKKIVDNFSESALYYVRHASDNILHKKFVNAYTSLERAIILDSSYFDAYFKRIQLNKTLHQANHNKYKNDIKTAINIISKKIEVDPHNEMLLLNRAKVYMLNDQYKEAIDEAQKVIKINKTNVSAYSILCDGLRKSEKWDKAIINYEKLLALNPDNDKEIRSHLVSVLKKVNQRAKAMESMNVLIKKYPSDGVLYLNRAFLLVESGQIDKSSADMDKAVELSGYDYRIFLKRSELYSFLKKNTEAQHDLENAVLILNDEIAKKPENIELLFTRAGILLKMKRNNDALKDYYMILKYLPENYAALVSIAKLEFMSHNWHNVLKCYETLRTCYKNEKEFFYNPAIVYLKLGDKKKALLYINQGLEILPNNVDMLYFRASLYFAMNNIELGKNDFKKLEYLLSEKKTNGTITKEEMQILDKINKEMQ